MRVRLFAVAAAIAAVLVVAGGLQAGAQTYPPPPASLTVDDPTPAPGQAITVTMSGCQPATFALFGVDVILLGSAKAGSDGVARATVSIPAALRAGAHTVSGFCIGANHLPLFLRTTITVTPASAPPPTTTPPAAPGSGTGSGGSTGGTGTGSSSSAGRSGSGRAGRSSAPAATVPSPDALASPTLPTDAPTMFEDAAEANGVPAGGSGSSGPGSPDATAAAATASTTDVGPLSTVARVALGLAAIFGVPVALAFSRRPGRPARPTRTTPRPA
ncbi:MAG TPA: hypothetical protein VH479_11610 [Acidimicrobiales bacterium]